MRNIWLPTAITTISCFFFVWVVITAFTKSVFFVTNETAIVYVLVIIFPLLAVYYLSQFLGGLSFDNRSIELDLDAKAFKDGAIFAFESLSYYVKNYRTGKYGIDFQYVVLETNPGFDFKLKIDLESFIELKEHIDKYSDIKIVKI